MLRNVRRALRGRKSKEERPAKRTSKIPYFLLAAAVSLPVLSAPAVADEGSLSASPKTDSNHRDTERALVQAAESGERTEVLSQRSETTQVFANPDGTLTQDTYALPQWVRQGKKLAEIDTTLHTGATADTPRVPRKSESRSPAGATGPSSPWTRTAAACPGPGPGNCPGPR